MRNPPDSQSSLNLNVDAAAVSLGVSPRTLRSLIAKREIRVVRIGRHVLVSRETLVAFIKSHEDQSE